MRYEPGEIEPKWQQQWEKDALYKVSNQSDKPKFYVLDMFPYPSGAGLHVGHPLGYIASDIVSRYKRLKGFNVLHPMGYDAFGLPAEQYAVQMGVHPAVSTADNIKTFRSQLNKLGFCYDWSREVKTSDAKYYKWTQWIFCRLFEHYYDLHAGKAKTVAALEKHFEASGTQNLNAYGSLELEFTASEWKAMNAGQKEEVLMNYRLMYRKEQFVNWCEELGTVLANDEVKDGFSERGGYPVVKKPMLQWSLRTTAYADRLLTGLKSVDWPDSLKIMQENWIGRSEGCSIQFKLAAHDTAIEVFTTRPDTIFGATFMVLAPEHDLTLQITTSEQMEDIQAYLKYVKTRSERDRMSSVERVSGAFTGAYATHPFTGVQMPVWIAEYVLKDYGTGAIMAVPARDERDQAFAEKFGLTITEIVDQTGLKGVAVEDKVGKMINSDFLNGLDVKDAIQAAMDRIDSKGLGKRKVNFKLRDANYSRQRYWGEPFPIVYDEAGKTHLLEDEQLPVQLPQLDDFQPSQDGRSPLHRAEDWVSYKPGWTRETDTMPGFAGSSWYFLRFMDPDNDNEFAAKEALEYWQDVDLYIGGAEHAVGHLLYARTWHKFLFDLGLIPTDEPFRKLVNQGMIQGRSLFLRFEQDGRSRELHVPVETVDRDDYLSRSAYEALKTSSRRFEGLDDAIVGLWEARKGKEDGIRLHAEVEKMSKSKYNTVNPDIIVEQYGADCFRMYEMFLGPLEQSKPWETKGIEGVSKFLRRFWYLFFDEESGLFNLSQEEPTREELKVLHELIKKVSTDIDRLAFNTSVSAFMVATTELKKLNCNKAAILEPMLICLAPFAPHITEELWYLAGNKESIHLAAMPVWHEDWLKEDEIEYPICINGKKRSSHKFSADASREEIGKVALALEEVQKWLDGKSPKKVIVVPGRMVNIVV